MRPGYKLTNCSILVLGIALKVVGIELCDFSLLLGVVLVELKSLFI
jgi:hypothetical protein